MPAASPLELLAAALSMAPWVTRPVRAGVRHRHVDVATSHLDTVVEVPALLGVVLVQLGLAAVPPPEAQHLVLGAVGHVDEPLEEPALGDGAADGAQDQAVVPHLQEEQVTGGVGARVDREALAVDLGGGLEG